VPAPSDNEKNACPSALDNICIQALESFGIFLNVSPKPVTTAFQFDKLRNAKKRSMIPKTGTTIFDTLPMPLLTPRATTITLTTINPVAINMISTGCACKYPPKFSGAVLNTKPAKYRLVQVKSTTKIPNSTKQQMIFTMPGTLHFLPPSVS